MTQDSQMLNIILSVAGTIIMILLAAISYFLRQFAKSVVSLEQTVKEMSTMLYVEQERHNSTKNTLVNTIERVDKLESKVAMLDNEVTVLQVKMESK